MKVITISDSGTVTLELSAKDAEDVREDLDEALLSDMTPASRQLSQLLDVCCISRSRV